MYSSYQIVIENEPECVNLQDIPILYMNSIALQFKDEQMTEFKVIEFALIILSMLISMICGARYLIVSMTYMCQTTINILALLSLMLMILPSITLCSKTFKMSLHMQRIIQLLYLSLFILGMVGFFFFLNSNLSRMQIVRKSDSRRSWKILCCLMNLMYVSYLHYVTVQYCNKEQPIRMQIVQKIMNTIVPII